MKGRHDKTRQQKARHIGEEGKVRKGRKNKAKENEPKFVQNLANFLNFVSMD
jgi:hypothetical protein